ncbi:Protein trichome birefringence-like 2 [Bienertia sinuspersici]
MASIKAGLMNNLQRKLHSKTQFINSWFGVAVGIACFILLFIIILFTNKTSPTSSFFFDYSSIVSWPFSLPKTSLPYTPENGTIIGDVVSLNDVAGNGSLSLNLRLNVTEKKERKTQIDNLDLELKNVSFHDLESRVFKGEANISRNSEYLNLTKERDEVGLQIQGEFDVRIDSRYNDDVDVGNLSKDCDIFDGKWVRDDNLPHYPPGSCPYIDRVFDCHLNGRPDKGFYKWRWQPFACNIPRYYPNLWFLSLYLCIFMGFFGSLPSFRRLMAVFQWLLKFYMQGYNCTIDYVRAPFLVRESSVLRKNESLATLRLDLMDETTHMYHDAHILVFNTGHWWTHEKTSRGEDYYQEGNHVHPRLKALKAYKKALATWGRWIDRRVDYNKTLVFFRGYSVTHFRLAYLEKLVIQ